MHYLYPEGITGQPFLPPLVNEWSAFLWSGRGQARTLPTVQRKGEATRCVFISPYVVTSAILNELFSYLILFIMMLIILSAVKPRVSIFFVILFYFPF